MYVRSRKPAAGIASASATRYETSSARSISTESAKYGTTEVAMSSRLRPTRGRVYGARASRQGRSLPGPPELGAAQTAAAGSRVPFAPFPLPSAATGAPAARGFAEDPRALLTPAAERAARSTRARDGSRLHRRSDALVARPAGHASPFGPQGQFAAGLASSPSNHHHFTSRRPGW